MKSEEIRENYEICAPASNWIQFINFYYAVCVKDEKIYTGAKFKYIY